jgi:hypothetical protein
MNVALKWTGHAILAARQGIEALKRQIPTHIQGLIWFQVAADGSFQSRPVFELFRPHCFWMSQWDEGGGGPADEPSKTGFYLWVIWDAHVGARRYIALCASEFKDVFYDSGSLNDLFMFQDRAILKRLRTFTYMDSIIHRKDHKLMEVMAVDEKAPNRPLLKQLMTVGLEESLYIPKNLTGGAILWLYHYICGTLPESSVLSEIHLVLTDYEMEDRLVHLTENMFE